MVQPAKHRLSFDTPVTSMALPLGASFANERCVRTALEYSM
jgi:hypothetical protein